MEDGAYIHYSNGKVKFFLFFVCSSFYILILEMYDATIRPLRRKKNPKSRIDFKKNHSKLVENTKSLAIIFRLSLINSLAQDTFSAIHKTLSSEKRR